MEHSLIFVVFIIIPLLAFLNYGRRLKRRILQKILERCFLQKHPANLWYSSQTVFQTARALCRLPRKKLQPVLADLRSGRIGVLRTLVNRQTMAEIRVICGKTAGRGDTLRQAETALLNSDFERAAALTEKICAQTPVEKARLGYLRAASALFDGDLQSAADLAADAIRRFRKLDFVYEEARAYLLSGTIFRVSAVTDTAEFMLRNAARLFAGICAYADRAEALASLGMLMVMQERFEEALEYFSDAQKLFSAAEDENGEAEIINQQALTALIRGDYTMAEKLAAKAYTAFRRLENPRGAALSLDIGSQTAAAQNNWKKAGTKARAAQKLYRQTGNRPAELETALMTARARLENGRPAEAEKILRQIIERHQKQPCCFHIANAYNLLGIIYLRQGDLRRAEGLFRQSLSSELQNERWSGAAIDYANIALTAYRRGHKDCGDQNRALALQYAQDAGAEKLAEMLKQKLYQ